MLRAVPLLLALVALSAPPARADDVSVTLDGSRASMLRQNQAAKRNDYTFLRTAAQVREFVDKGYLVPIEGNADYRVDDGVSFPFARPEMRTFIERLGAQYREGCGEPLVVTSLTRPRNSQPRNSHPLSVHPTGMAVDLRVSRSPACVRWLEDALLSLEEQGLLDITREHRPPHFHVALFTDAYREYVEPLIAAEEEAKRKEAAAERARLAAERARLAREAAVRQASIMPATTQEEHASPGKRLAVGVATWAAFALGLTLRQRRRADEPSSTAGDSL